MDLSNELCSPPLMRQNLDENEECYEILSHNGETNMASDKKNQRKKRSRRRSSSNAPDMVLRKEESRMLHSTIEKRRRLKISREYEALKYLIPACRNTASTSMDGMQKLVILKASVEYIQYLHRIVRQQNSLISRHDPSHDFDDSFADIKVDVNTYRDLSKNVVFGNLASLDSSIISSEQRSVPPSPIADDNLGSGAGFDPCLYQLNSFPPGSKASEPRSIGYEVIADVGLEIDDSQNRRIRLLRKVQISALLN